MNTYIRQETKVYSLNILIEITRSLTDVKGLMVSSNKATQVKMY